jgi:glycosyltransferase involved in cell wall biosynthesis
MLTSIVIRTYNEETHLDELLQAIASQVCDFSEIETIIVDSGSTDSTMDIASNHGCRVTSIPQAEFSFGRSLNIGCEFAKGDYLVFISGHCIPVDEKWVENLIYPISEQVAAYSYGRQVGRDSTKFSEAQYFEKTFPQYSKTPQQGYFCNNANSAITRQAWHQFKFDEELTGLEDMHLAQKLVNDGQKIAYVADAPVYHIHDESWKQVQTRYEREAYALHQVMPQLHFTLGDFFRFFLSGMMSDSAAALREKRFLRELPGIFMFRLMHYWGTYKGNHEVRQLSAEMKHKYFYPKDVERQLYDD